MLSGRRQIAPSLKKATSEGRRFACTDENGVEERFSQRRASKCGGIVDGDLG